MPLSGVSKPEQSSSGDEVLGSLGRELASILPRRTPRVLLLGCAPILPHLEEILGTATLAIDSDESLLCNFQTAYGNCELRHADPLATLPGGSYELVLVHGLLGRLAPREVLGRLGMWRKALAPSGTLALTFVPWRLRRMAARRFRAAERFPALGESQYWHEPSEIAFAARGAGCEPQMFGSLCLAYFHCLIAADPESR